MVNHRYPLNARNIQLKKHTLCSFTERCLPYLWNVHDIVDRRKNLQHHTCFLSLQLTHLSRPQADNNAYDDLKSTHSLF